MEQEKNQVNIPKVDLRLLLTDLLHVASRMLWLVVALIVVLGLVFGLHAYRSYTPRYRAEATFTVTVDNPLYSGIKAYNTAAAEQMAKTFPYILSSDVLGSLVKERLGTEFLPPVTASVLPNTNIFTLAVTSDDAQTAYATLKAFMECYPEVAERVVGPTRMSLLSESGIPAGPYNHANVFGGVRKGAVLGVVLWAVIVLLAGISRSTIHNEEELKRLTNLSCLGTIPFCGPKKRDSGYWPALVAGGDRFGFS